MNEIEKWNTVVTGNAFLQPLLPKDKNNEFALVSVSRDKFLSSLPADDDCYSN